MARTRPGTAAPSLSFLAGALTGAAFCVIGIAGLALAGLPGAGAALVVSIIAGALLMKGASGRHKTLLAETPATAPAAERAQVPAEPPPDRIDSLTGLANENGLMAWFAERGPRLVEDRQGIVVLSANLEGFDAILKTRGREVADKVLIEVAQRVAVFAGQDGIAARTGGNEFASVATVVPEHSEEVAAETAARLTEMLQRPVELPDGVIWIGGTVGAASGPASEGKGVLDRARAALERAKPLGRGQYVVDRR